MTDYVKELEDGIVNKQVIQKFDALESILFHRVIDSFQKQTADEVYPLQSSLSNMLNSFPVKDILFGWEYNCDVNIRELTPVQTAYLQGKLAAYCNIVNHIGFVRPTKSELDFAKSNIELLKTMDMAEYDNDIHGEFLMNGLISTPMHGKTRICILTRFAHAIIRSAS